MLDRFWGLPLAAVALVFALAAPVAGAAESQIPLVAGNILTVAGSGPTAAGTTFVSIDPLPTQLLGDGEQATSARLKNPTAVAVDSAGNLLIADTYDHRVRRVDAHTGVITTVAGTGAHIGGSGQTIGDGGPATAASLSSPQGLAIDAVGNIYIASSGQHRVRKVAPDGTITTIAGTGGIGNAGDGGAATAATLSFPMGLALDRDGTLYISSFGAHRVRAVSLTTGKIRTVAGSGDLAFGGFRGDGGPAIEAQLRLPQAVALDPFGNLFISDNGNHRIRRVDRITGIITTIAGNGSPFYAYDGGLALHAGVTPGGLVADLAGDVLWGDTGSRVLRIDGRTNVNTTLAGANQGLGGDGGLAREASLLYPQGLALSPDAGALYIADSGNNRIRKVLLRLARIDSVSPAAAQGSVPITLTLTGSHFTGVTSVSLDDPSTTPLTDLHLLDDGRLQATIPRSIAPGFYGLRVTNASGRTPAGKSRVLVQGDGVSPTAPVARFSSTFDFSADKPTFVLDASNSFDADPGDALTYSWSLTASAVATFSFSSTAATTRCTFPGPGSYSFTLTVTDKSLLTSVQVLGAGVTEFPPYAYAGNDFSFILPDPAQPPRLPAFLTTDTVRLDGSQSGDADGESLTYQWTLTRKPAASSFTAAGILEPNQPSTRVKFSSAANGQGRSVDAGFYTFQLAVSDKSGQVATAGVAVFAESAGQIAPGADPGLDRDVSVTVVSPSPLTLAADISDPTLPPDAAPVDFVRLDGRRSRDPSLPPAPLTYSWSIKEKPQGSAVTGLTGADTATPFFRPDVAGTFVLGLAVTSQLGLTSTARSVSVRVSLRNGNHPPTALAFLREPLTNRVSSPVSAVLTFAPGTASVELDGSGSIDLEDGGSLAYLWVQVAGTLVTLVPSATAPRVSFLPPESGPYEFQLTVRDSRGASSEPVAARAIVLPPAARPPSFSVRATADNTGTTGVDLGERTQTVRSLRVRIPATVTLEATLLDPTVSGGPAGNRVVMIFTQTSGAPVLLDTRSVPGAGEIRQARFGPTVSGVLEFEVRAVVVTASGAPTGTDLAKRIRVVCESAAGVVPQAVASAAVRKLAPRPCQALALDGSLSSATGGSRLAYTWVQTAGPAVELSSSFSAVTTFVAPDFGDDAPRQYFYELFVDNGQERSEPAIVSIVVDPLTTGTASLTLGSGFSLVGMPVRPGEPGTPATAAELLAKAGATFVGRFDSASQRFRLFGQGLGLTSFPLLPSEGYLVIRTGSSVDLAVSGPPWGRGLQSRQLSAGLNLVTYVRGVPPGQTAADLATLCRAAFVGRAVRTARGPNRLEVYVPGLTTTPFLIREGDAYLVSVPASQTVTLPTCR